MRKKVLRQLRQSFRSPAAKAAFDAWAARNKISGDSDSNPLEPRIEDGRLQLRLYRPIGSWWGCVTAEHFDDALQNRPEPLDIYVDCPGGDVLTTRAINRRILERKSESVFHVDGLAASAATLIACACDRRLAARGTRILIHEAWTIAIGNKRALRAEADDLAKIDAEIADDYAAIGSRSAAEFAALMEAEDLMTPEDALACGLLDAVARAKHQTDDQIALRSAYARHLATIS